MVEQKEIEISREAQHMVLQLQQYQQQMQALAMQKQQLELQLAEFNAASEALKETKEKDVFKSVGPVLVRDKKDSVEKEIKGTMETIDLRIKATRKQEERLKEKVKEISDKLVPLLKTAGISG